MKGALESTRDEYHSCWSSVMSIEKKNVFWTYKNSLVRNPTIPKAVPDTQNTVCSK